MQIDGGRKLTIMNIANPLFIATLLAAWLTAQAFIPSVAYSAGGLSLRKDSADGIRRPTFVEIAADRMTAALQDAPIGKVLEILAVKTDARIVFHGNIEETLSANFTNRPLEAALRSLFQGWNLAFFYSSAGSGQAQRLSEILILDSQGGIDGNGKLFTSKKTDGLNERGSLSNQADREGDKDAATIAQLAEVLRRAEDRGQRVEAAKQLGKTWSEHAVGPLADALAQDQDASVREAAAAALGRSWSENALEPLSEALANDRDARVREQAARALAQTAGEEAVPALARALTEDRRWFVREAAAAALGAIGGRDALDALVRASTHDRDAWVKETAVLGSF
jgi:HEAT repeat protein